MIRAESATRSYDLRNCDEDTDRRTTVRTGGAQEKLKGGATIGELIDVDHVFASTFDYQTRALKPGG